MKKRIHVNQHIIKANGKAPAFQRQSPLTVKTSNRNVRATDVEIQGPSRLVYRPNKPLSCGAKVWIETEARLTITNERGHTFEMA